MNMNALSYQRMQLAYSKKGYTFFTNPYDLNIFGIRSQNKKSGLFDDLIGIAYTGSAGDKKLFLCSATTDPSEKWLLKPLHPNGTAIVLEGQYRSCYKLGIHGRTWTSGGYPALEQVGKMKYVRDNNKDSTLDFDSNSFWGILKTNIHRASSWEIVDRIGSYSAGCQVIQDPEKFRQFMVLCNLQKSAGWGDHFTYTLFNEKDFR